MKRKNLQITIETGFGGGSISIFADKSVIDFWTNDAPQLKPENLLERISPLLEKNDLAKSDISEIIYAKNNGSQTGLKVGESIAKGLALGLNAGISGRDLFESLQRKFRGAQGGALTILPYGKNDLECRFYNNFEFREQPQSFRMKDLINFSPQIESPETLTVFTQSAIIENHLETLRIAFGRERLKIKDLGANLSQYLI